MNGEQDRPTDGSFYAVGGTLRKAPFHQKKDDTTTISMGFAVAELSEWVDEDFAGEIAACLNAHDELVAALKPFAKLGEIILAEAPAEAKTIVLFTSASGEKFSMQLDYFRAASRAAIAALAKSTP